MLGNRSWQLIARNIGRGANYAAVWRMRDVCLQPREMAWRYLSGRGTYPWRCALRSPLGVVRPVVHSHDDLVTVTEVFCRLDYEARTDVRAVLDVGSNIGISALYFLTRNANVECRLYEPVPRNVERLRENLAGFEDRYELTQAAVWDTDGRVAFGVEPTGRYGGIGVAAPETITVEAIDINRVVEGMAEIDLLKVDTEGAEIATVRAIREDLLERIRLIYLETMERPALHEGRFDASFSCDTMRLVNRSPRRALDARRFAPAPMLQRQQDG